MKMELRLEAPIYAEDGPVGYVGRLIYDPERGKVVALVGVAGRLVPRDVVIPIDRVRRAHHDRVEVVGTVEEIAALPPFSMEQYTAPPEEWIPPPDTVASQFLFPASPYVIEALILPSTQPDLPPDKNLPPGDVDLAPDMPVFAIDGRVGAVQEVITREEGRVLAIVVWDDLPPGRRVRVPLNRVAVVEAAGVFLDMSRAAFEQLADVEDERAKLGKDEPPEDEGQPRT
ncbi:MAG: PRC-barrel domain-containing protein [Armatimonadetes bacterium]|nr:PRC-barrel domain-containing protein [Armatimonadota bacterium]